MIVHRACQAAQDFHVAQVVLAGGVSANSYLRAQMTERLKDTGIDLIIPPLWCTTDNAAMIAMAGCFKYADRDFCPMEKPAYSRVEI